MARRHVLEAARQRARHPAPGSTLLGLALSTTLLLGCRADAPDGPAGASSAGPQIATDACPAETVERRPLVLPDGLHAYVEPHNLMRVGDDLVVVGWPSYTWEVGGTRVRMVTQDSHIAAYLDEERPRLVERPVDVPFGMVRSVALDERRWGVLLAEETPDNSGPIGWVLSLWYAEYDGEAWSSPEQLPLPADAPERNLFAGTASPLVRHGGALEWVVAANGGGPVLHYTRRDGVWSFRALDGVRAEAAALASGPSGLWLALTGLDPGVSGPRKAVQLLWWDEGWQLVSRTPAAEEYTQIRRPSLLAGPDGMTVTWTEQGESDVAMARIGFHADQPGRLVVVDPSASVVRALTLTSGEPAWVLEHVNTFSRASELRLVQIDGRTAVVRQTLPHPYTGYFAALAAGPDDVLVTGAEFSPDPARPTVRSLTLRLNPTCR